MGRPQQPDKFPFFPPIVPVTFTPADYTSDEDVKPSLGNIKTELIDEHGKIGGEGCASDTDNCYRAREKRQRQLERLKTREYRRKQAAKREKSKKKTKKIRDRQRRKRQIAKGKTVTFVIQQYIGLNLQLKDLEKELNEEQRQALHGHLQVALNIVVVKKIRRVKRCRKCRGHNEERGVQHRSAESGGYKADCPYDNCPCLRCKTIDRRNRRQNKKREDAKAGKWREEERQRRQQQHHQIAWIDLF